MKKAIHHQKQNTDRVILTTYRYDHSSNAGPIGVTHFHKNYEILIPVAGRSDITVEETTYTVRPGEAVLIHPFQPHRLHLGQRSYLWCSAFSARLAGSLDGMLEGTVSGNPVFSPAAGVTQFFLGEMMRCFGSWGEWNTITPEQKLAAKACLYAMGSEYLGQSRHFLERSAKKTDRLALAVTGYVAEHFKEGITLRDVAVGLGYNYQYLSKSFHALVGMNFRQLLNQYRMEHATALLLESRLSVTQIAFESGFQSLRTFNYVCRETLGCTPGEMRAEAQRKGKAPQ